MSVHSKNVTPTKCVAVIAFALFAMCSLLAFGYYTLDVTISLMSKKEIIEFNKGAMCMFGVGLGSGLLVILMIYELTGKEISSSYNKKATNFALMATGLIFVFPLLVDNVIRSKMGEMDYVFCEGKSYQWFHVQNKVYGVNTNACGNFKSSEAKKSSSRR